MGVEGENLFHGEINQIHLCMSKEYSIITVEGKIILKFFLSSLAVNARGAWDSLEGYGVFILLILHWKRVLDLSCMMIF